jgi:aspartyl/asparaginyl-tRNA synthetase
MYTIPHIDYKKILSAIDHYSLAGYSEIEAPWIVKYESYATTKLPQSRDFYTVGGYLNASGEQSFIEMMRNGTQLTKNFCITPCFRNEEILDDIHHTYFLKLELIDTNVSIENLQTMIDHAVAYFTKYLPLQILQTDTKGVAFDIIDSKNHIELGSYGIRRTKDFSWIYGTGVALPRLDTVIKKQ